MKKLLLSTLIISIASTSLVMATRAYFSDTETSTGNTFAAATIDLKTNDTDGTSKSYVLTNMHPGSWDGAGQVMLKNAGNLKGHAWLEVKNIQNNENGCNEPESETDDTSCDSLQGELGQFVRLSFERNREPWGVRYGMTQVIDNAAGVKVDLEDLDPGATLPIYVYGVWSPTNTDNLAQGDSVSFDVIFHLDQVTP